VTWFRGVLDEDERMHARLAGSGMQGFEARDEEPWSHFGEPGRIAADIEAKRSILALHRPTEDDYADQQGNLGPACRTCHEDAETAGYEPAPLPYPCPTVRLIASAYRDRPGYREEWAPDKG